jgi:TM2 domain-containing membrane protein YozV
MEIPLCDAIPASANSIKPYCHECNKIFLKISYSTGICRVLLVNSGSATFEDHMKKSLKGSLLSGLVFPGVGQISLKHKMRGIILICIILVSFGVMIAKGTQIALGVLQEIESEGGILDMQTISSVSERAVSASDSYIMHGSILLIILCWIFGIIDAYKIGKKLEKE